MPGRMLLVGLVMALGLTAFQNAAMAAGKHGGRVTSVRARGVPDGSALGPRIDYPRQPRSFSASSERSYTGGQINAIPFRSPAEALEIVPGLAVGR